VSTARAGAADVPADPAGPARARIDGGAGPEPIGPAGPPWAAMDAAIRARRSVKAFTDRPVPREVVEELLELAVLAPNHRLTEPWGFLVLGPEAKRALGRVLGRRKARKVADPAAAEAVRAKVEREVLAVPVILAVTCAEAEDPEVRAEDSAATFMAIENLLIAAAARGLGTHLKTGAVMDDPELRAALGVEAGRRIVAQIYLGEPAERPAPRPRTPAAEKTRWLE